MKYALIGLSIVGNVIFLGVLLAAYSDSGDGKDSAEHLNTLRGVPPEGLRWRRTGPLYLAELAFTDTQDPSAISDTIFVTFEGCILATFEFDDGFVALSDSQLYDLACRPRVSLDVRNGAAVYSVYEDSSDPIYSTVDEDADGMPDRKVNWITNESFVRSGAIPWRKVTQGQPNATETVSD